MNIPIFGNSCFNDLCDAYFGGRTDRQRAIKWFNDLTMNEKACIETKYRTLLITDSNIERIYKQELNEQINELVKKC